MKLRKRLKPLFLFFLFLSPVFFFPASGEELISRNGNRCSILTYERPAERAGSFDEPPPNITIGEQKTIILMAHTPDRLPPAEAAREAVDYEAFYHPAYSLNAFFEESSLDQEGNRQIWFTGNTVGWYVLPHNSDYYGKDDFVGLEKAVMEVADKDVDFSQYTRMIFVFWEQIAGAAAYMQMRRFETGDGVVWLTSSYLDYEDFFSGLKQHEVGHNLGWWHGGGALLPEEDDRCSCEVGELKHSLIYDEICGVQTYRDIDIMGGGFFQPSGWRKRKAGWLKPEQCLEVRENKIFWLDQRALPSDGIKLAEIPVAPCVSGGSPASFTLELFSSLGIDYFSWEGKDKFLIVRYHTGDRCIIPSFNDSVMFAARDVDLPVFFDRDSYCNQEFGFEIKFLGYSGEGIELKAQVEVNFWCPEKMAPDVSARIEPQKIYTGESFDCLVSLTNNCQIGCGTRTYSLSLEMPPQMQAAAMSPVEIAPYSTAETTIRINTSPDIPPGIYKVVVTATDTESSDIIGTGEASITIVDLRCASAKLRKLKAKPKRVITQKTELKTVTVTALGTSGCFMEGQDVIGRILTGREKIEIRPLITTTDENGCAFFTIIAHEIGTATVQFETFWGEFPTKVQVKVK